MVFIFRGDASGSCDEPVESKQILGKVVAVERNGCRIALDRRKTKMLNKVHAYASRLKRRMSPFRLLRFILLASVLLLMSRSAQAQMLTGYYSGNAVDNRAITLLGFQPDVVIIKELGTAGVAVCRTSTMTGDITKPLVGTTALTADMIQSLDSNGFTVGTNDAVNKANDDYYWMAFKAVNGELAVGSYTGNGFDSRTIDISDTSSSTDFQPDYVIVMSAAANAAVQRFSSQSGDSSFQFNASGPESNLIQAFSSTGFQVGNDARVNNNGTTYHYIAWKAVSGKMQVGTYIGNEIPKRDIAVGFRPEWVILKGNQSIAPYDTYHHPASLGPTNNLTLRFDAINARTNEIIQLEQTDGSNGFQVDDDVNVNEIGVAFFWAAFGRSNPTAVKLVSFKASGNADSILLQWRTGYEVDNLGFHVYREENGQLYRLTPELIAGSALLAGSGTALTAGRSYTWWDFLPEGTGQVQYWLEDVDLNGKSTMHGPVEIKPLAISGQQSALKHGQAKFLSELGMRLEERYREHWRAQELRERLSLKRSATKDRGALRSRIASLEKGSILEARGASPQGNEVPAPLASRPKADRLMQHYLASMPAVKISVKEEGWYRISQSELVSFGLNPGINPRYLQLFVDGKEQPISVVGEKDGKFDPEDAIEFYGVGLDTPSTDTRVYWLIAGSRPGKRIQLYNGRGGQLASSSFPYTVERKDRTIYFAALKNGDEDNFFGPVITAEPVDQLMSVLHLDQALPGEAMLEVALQGATNVPHRIKVLLNETEVGEVVFDGQSPGTAGFTIPQALLLEGDNLVSLIAQGGEMDVSVVDYIRLTYWHTYTADDDALKFTAQGGKQISIAGFSNPKIRVIDITNPKALLEVAGKVTLQGTGYSNTFRVPGYGQRTLLALTDERVKNPAGIVANQPSSWHQSSGYDFVIIAHRDFLQNIEPLKKLRQSQGLSVALIDVEDIYDEFSFGAKSPQALRDFLSLSKNQWSKPPRFLLLVGDASFDSRNYLGFGDLDFVPTKLIDTSYLETASDDWFVDFNGNGLPEMAVGRLPVRTADEANTVISKIIGYEQSAPIMEALLVADKNDGFNFEAASEEVGALLQPHVSIREIFRGNFSSNAGAKNELLSSIDQGPLLVNYTGHGSVEIWRGNILTSDDADSLINGLRLPFLVSMTCLNGFFHDLYTESLAEALLKAKQGGAMAVWASSGLTEPGGQTVMDKELIRLLFNGNSLTIGEATKRAKAAVGDQDIRRTWILFGDPTTRLK